MTDITQEQLASDRSAGFNGVEYNRVASVASLKDVRLLRLRSDVRPEAMTSKTLLSYGRDLVSCDYEPENGSAAAILRFHVTAKSGRKTTFQVQAEYLTLYDVGMDAQPNAARAFVNNVGLFAAYPYFRALVAQIAWGSGTVLPPLPTIASTAYKSALAVPNTDEA